MSVTQRDRELRLVSSLNPNERRTGAIKSLRSGVSKSQCKIRWNVLKTIVRGVITAVLNEKEILKQKESVYRLVEEGKVTIHGDADFEQQGNLDLYTTVNLQKRRALRRSPKIEHILKLFWAAFPDTRESDELSKTTYIDLNVRLHLALVPGDPRQDDCDTKRMDEAYSAAEWDWNEDTSKQKDGKMTENTFCDSIFELTDTWTEGVSEVEYAAFIWKIMRLCFDFGLINFPLTLKYLQENPPTPFYGKTSSAPPELVQVEMQEMIHEYLAVFEDSKPGIPGTSPEKEEFDSPEEKSFNNLDTGEFKEASRPDESKDPITTCTMPDEKNEILKFDKIEDPISCPAPSIPIPERKTHKRHKDGKRGRPHVRSAGGTIALGNELLQYMESVGAINSIHVKEEALHSHAVTMHGTGYIPCRAKRVLVRSNYKGRRMLVKSTHAKTDFKDYLGKDKHVQVKLSHAHNTIQTSFSTKDKKKYYATENRGRVHNPVDSFGSSSRLFTACTLNDVDVNSPSSHDSIQPRRVASSHQMFQVEKPEHQSKCRRSKVNIGAAQKKSAKDHDSKSSVPHGSGSDPSFIQRSQDTRLAKLAGSYYSRTHMPLLTVVRNTEFNDLALRQQTPSFSTLARQRSTYSSSSIPNLPLTYTSPNSQRDKQRGGYPATR